MNRLLRYALRNGWRRGLIGGSRRWLVIGGIAAGIRVLRKIADSEQAVVYREELHPGETLVIAHGRAPDPGRGGNVA